MRRSSRQWLARGAVIWMVLLGCRTSDLVARVQVTATSTALRSTSTPRPTFTRAAPTAPIPPTIALAPTNPPIVNLAPPTARSAAPVPTFTRAPQPAATARPPTPVPPPTADLYQGYYYRVTKNVCTTSLNTRAEGIVLNNGVPQDGVIVRIANGNGGDPVIDDYVTGIDPASNNKKTSPEWKGRYKLGVAEGQQIAGNWWVFIIDEKGAQISVGAYFNTHDSNGCNTAVIDFAH